MLRKRKISQRIVILEIFFILIGAAIAVRLFYLQVFMHEVYAEKAELQQTSTKKITPDRGEIYMHDLSLEKRSPEQNNLVAVALNKKFPMIYVSPNEIPEEERESTANSLAGILSIDSGEILKKLSVADDPYEPLKHKLDVDTTNKIKQLNLAGVHLLDEYWRYYPNGRLAGPVIGFVSSATERKVGQYGVEGYYEDILSGQSEVSKLNNDALGYLFFGNSDEVGGFKNGDSLVLTLDQNIEWQLETKLKDIADKLGSASACGIIMEPQTGRILAMTALPGFDPNEYSKVNSISDFSNSCVQTPYEPGSVMKPITMSAGIDMGLVSPQSTFEDTGVVKIGSYEIKNNLNKQYGQATMTNVLENSINTGAVFVEQALGRENFLKYFFDFGLDKITGIDLASEAKSNFSNLKQKAEINFATASFGQGVAVTPIQMITALGALANNGTRMKPYIVDKILHTDGSETITKPQEVAQVIKTETANQLSAMLVSASKMPFYKMPLKESYYMAVKTGTAQIANLTEGGYYTDEVNHSFIGFVPAFDPKFIVYLKLEKPHGVNFAVSSLAPMFSELAQYMLTYFEVPPDIR